MNSIGANSLYGHESCSVGRAGYVYGVVQEQIVSSSKTTILLLPELVYENNPVPGAYVGSIVNIYV